MYNLPLIVVLTRSVADNAILAEQLRSSGYSFIDFPAIKIVDSFPAAQKINFTKFKYLVFTSSKAVQAASRYLKHTGQGLPISLEVAVVGAATSETFYQEFGRSADVQSTDFNSKSLANLLLQHLVPSDRVLFITGNLTLNTLPAILEKGGVLVESLNLYQNIPVKPDLKSLELLLQYSPQQLVFPFYSPSAVTNVQQMLGADAKLLNMAKVISLGASTTCKLKELNIPVYIELREASTTCLLASLSSLQTAN